MKFNVGMVAVGVSLLIGSVPAQAQLARQNVQGTWRECVYRVRPTAGLRRDPRARLGVPNERAVRVGRGEPCPQTYPGDRRSSRSRQPTRDYVVLQ